MLNADEIIASTIDELANRILGVRRHAPAVEAMARALATVEGLPYHVADVDSDRASVTVYECSGPLLVEIRRALAAEGYHLIEGGVTEHQKENAQHHRLANADGLCVNVWVWFGGTTGTKRCSYVKTGTKLVEEPVYELRCEEVEPEVVAQPAATDGLPF